MPDEFLIRAGLAGIGVALVAGPLGCFVVWRRMAYFGDATAHAAILGVALALVFTVSTVIGVLASAAGMALMVTSFSGRIYAADTLLGVAAHAALAVGLVAVSLTARTGVNIDAFLFGEILAVSRTDLAVIWGGALVVDLLLAWRWSALLTATLNPDIAFASAIDPRRESLILALALAVVVAVALKVIGALLITAMLIIPAATARPLVRSPEAMALVAVLAGCGAVVVGLLASYNWDTPTGPTIVTVAAGLFAVSNVGVALWRRKSPSA